jgi:hypothetical protein
MARATNKQELIIAANSQFEKLWILIGSMSEGHREVLKLIESFTNEELFTKKYYSWTGTTSLGSYAVSSTSSHYDWAIKKLKQHIKS